MILPVGLFSLFQRRKLWVRIEYIGPLDQRGSQKSKELLNQPTLNFVVLHEKSEDASKGFQNLKKPKVCS